MSVNQSPRMLPILNDSGDLRDDAALVVAAYQIHPEDEASARQILNLLRTERDRAKEVGMETYEPTEFSKDTWGRVINTSGQRMACGLTVLAASILQGIEGMKGKVTPYKATRAVECAFTWLKRQHVGKRNLTLNWLPEKGGYMEKLTGQPTDQRAILGAYNNYRSMGHVIGAAMVGSEHYPRLSSLNADPATITAILAYAKFVKNLLPAEFVQTEKHGADKPPWGVPIDREAFLFAGERMRFAGNSTLATMLIEGIVSAGYAPSDWKPSVS